MLRRKGFILTAALICAALLLVVWGQPWFVFQVALPSTAETSISVDGSVVASALSGLTLASLAVIAVLSISSGIFAAVLTALLVVIALGALTATIGAFFDPLAAALPIFTKLTGLLTAEGIKVYVQSVELTPAIFIASIVCIMLLLISIFGLWNVRRWGTRRSAKYERRDVRSQASISAISEPDTISSWDDLSTGIDPTTR
jgi:hypothetical protein